MNVSRIYEKLWLKLLSWFESLVDLLPNLSAALLVMISAFGIAKMAFRPADRVLKGLGMYASARLLVVRLIQLGATLALSILKLDRAATSLLAGAGIVGLALGFAFQDLAANFISGIGLSFRRPFNLGDLVETNETLGIVEKVELRNSMLRTLDGQMVLIPNKEIFQERLINYSFYRERRVSVSCGVSYEANLERVREIALEAVSGIPGRLLQKAPECIFTGFGDSSILFEIRFWIGSGHQRDYLVARSEAIFRIKAAFDRENISIPFPIRTVEFGGRKPVVVENAPKEAGGHTSLLRGD